MTENPSAFWREPHEWSWDSHTPYELATLLTVRDLERLDPEDDSTAHMMQQLPVYRFAPLPIATGTKMLPGGFFVDAWGRLYRRDRKETLRLRVVEYVPVRNMALGALVLLSILSLCVSLLALLSAEHAIAGFFFGPAVLLAGCTTAFYFLFARNHIRAFGLAAETAKRARGAVERYEARRQQHLSGS